MYVRMYGHAYCSLSLVGSFYLSHICLQNYVITKPSSQFYGIIFNFSIIYEIPSAQFDSCFLKCFMFVKTVLKNSF